MRRNISSLLLFSILLIIRLDGFGQPDFSLAGFATMNGGTTGGRGGATVTARNYNELKSYAESNTTYIIMVEGTISNGSSGGSIRIRSNKSIIGVGNTAFLQGVALNITNYNNIIIQNLKITLVGTSNPSGVNGGDCVSINGTSKNVWIDHCEIYSEDPDKQTNIDKYDGLLDIRDQTGFITVSWCYFHNHHKGCLVGAGENDLFNDRKVTYHHNYFNKVRLRVPMYRGATGHFFNNYIAGARDASEIRNGACVRVEKNYYESLRYSIYTPNDYKGSTQRIDNIEVSRTSRAYPANCTADIPYSYSSVLTSNTADVKTIVPQYAGVGKINVVNQPAVLTKQGGGASSQTLITGQTVQSFYYSWQNAASVTVTGLPNGINAAINSSAKTVTFSGAPAEAGIFSYTVTTVGGNPNTSATGTFTVSSNQPAALTKHGGGSSSQTVTIGQSIQGFHYAWQNATTVRVSGLPKGVNALINNSARTITFSGAPTEAGIFSYTITTEGGNPNTSGGGTFTVNFDQPAVLTKHGSGSSSQTVEAGQPIQEFYFAWQYAVTVTVAGLPDGVNALINNTVKTVTFSGTPVAAGSFTYTVTTIGGSPNTNRSEIITVNEAVPKDCNNDINGSAFLDACGVCVGGKTGFEECSTVMEAEEACEVDGILLEDRNEGFSGAGYVNTTNAVDAYVSWMLHGSDSGTYTITFRYANGGGDLSRNARVLVNREEKGTLLFPSTAVWTNWANATMKLEMPAGISELRLESLTEGGLANLDMLYFSEGLQASGCVITGFPDKAHTAVISIYPNPTSGLLHIFNTPDFWRLTDSFGVELQSGSGESRIDLSTYPAGVYYLLTDTQTSKVIKK